MSAKQTSVRTVSRQVRQAQQRNKHLKRQNAPLILPVTDSVLVVDLEATCWDKQPPPPGEQNEIIEVGWALLDVPSNHLTRTGTTLVKPIKSRVSTFCTQLTTITQEMVDEEGVTLKEAFEFLVKELDSKKISWASYGAYDRNMVRKQCGIFGLDYPFGSVHTNVKTLFNERYKDHKGSCGMSDIYRRVMGKEIEGIHHRGGDDAKNIATMLGTLLNMK
jgi:inhibitor of KinA sporulation pathway (predicted exonuclease)